MFFPFICSKRSKTYPEPRNVNIEVNYALINDVLAFECIFDGKKDRKGTKIWYYEELKFSEIILQMIHEKYGGFDHLLICLKIQWEVWDDRIGEWDRNRFEQDDYGSIGLISTHLKNNLETTLNNYLYRDVRFGMK